MTSVTAVARKTALTTWEGIWYVLENIALGAGYFGKIPLKKAMQDFGLTTMTGAEQFWYVIQCLAFGAGYFAKIPAAKALSELPQFRSQRQIGLGTLTQVQSQPSIQAASPRTTSASSTPPSAPATPLEAPEYREGDSETREGDATDH